jgi:NADH-quinone oxidoreductase subunit C
MENLILKKLKEKFADSIVEIIEFRGELTVLIGKESLMGVCQFLKNDSELKYNFLSDISGVDFLGREKRFEVVYNLYSIPNRWRVRLKVNLAEDESVDSLTSLWDAANWLEREAFDMFGIKFNNHPDLKRILMPDDWIGHPLRKDFPLTKEEVTFSHNKDKPSRIVE